MAVALAAPGAFVAVSYVTPAVAQTTASPNELLQQGMKQQRDGQYEEAVKTLKGINADSLSASGQSMLRDTLTKAEAAAAQRQAARDAFEAGQKALAAGDSAAAQQQFRTAATNQYADAGTKQRAAEQLALAQATAGTATPPAGTATGATAAAPTGTTGATGATAAAPAGTTGTGAAPTGVTAAPTGTTAAPGAAPTGTGTTGTTSPPPTVVTTPVRPTPSGTANPAVTGTVTSPSGTTATVTAVPGTTQAPGTAPAGTGAAPGTTQAPPPSVTATPGNTYTGSTAAAPTGATGTTPTVITPGAAPGTQGSPTVVTQTPPVTENVGPERTTPGAAPTVQQTAPPPAVTDAGTPTTATPPGISENEGAEQPVVSRSDARELYLTAREQYRKGDWIAARKNFEAAQAAGYKPRMFEDSPKTYLARMDKKEQADSARASRQTAQNQASAAAEAPRPQTQTQTQLQPAPGTAQPTAAQPTVVQTTVQPGVQQPTPQPGVGTTTPPPQPQPQVTAQQAPGTTQQPTVVQTTVVPPPGAQPGVQPGTGATPTVVQPGTQTQTSQTTVVQPGTGASPTVVQPGTGTSVMGQARPTQTPQTGTMTIQTTPGVPGGTSTTPTGQSQTTITEQTTVRTTPQPRQTTASEDLAATAKMSQAEQVQRAAEARTVVEQARAAQNEQRYSDALSLYQKALQLDPSNRAASAGQAQMLTMTGRTAPTSQLQQVEQKVRIARQEINYQFDQALSDMRDAIARNDYTAAQESLNRARVARNANPNVFTPEEIRAFDTRLATAQQTVSSAQADYIRQNAIKQQRDTEQALQEARKAQETERVRTVADLTRNARQLINETRYKEALDVLDQILVLDPTNDYAAGVRPLVEDKALIQEQRRYREDFDRQFTKQMNAADEMKIPYDDILRYPTNWPDISELRDQTTSQEIGRGRIDAATQQQLAKELPELRFDNIGFADVIDFLRDISGANIFVSWRALEASGIDKNTPVTARLRNVKFSKALQTILADVGGGTVPLGYTVDEGVITISTEEELSRNTATRVYDIRDLIIDVPDFPGPNVQLSNVGQGGGGRGGGGGGGGSLFSDSGSNDNATNVQPRTRQELVDDIVQLITETVAPDSWREAGGTVGSVRELSGQLIVTQTPENQRQLQGLLDQLRETRAIQITIETRFLTVQKNFLEDVGFDVDLVLNNDLDSRREFLTDGGFGPIPFIQSSSIYTANPATGLPGSIQNINNGVVTNENNGLGLASLALSGTYLDNFGVQFLLRATQAAQSTTLLTAPRLTLFNGQRAYVAVTRVTAYVSDLEPVVAQNAVAFNPTIALFPSGVVLDVQATVSADRKYVTLTLRPTLTTLLQLLPFTFQTAETGNAGGGTTQPATGGGVAIIDTGTGGTNPASGTIQTPIFQLTQVRTTVSVPDGGTLLLGGQTLAGEIEREAGVPVLSKIPFLKRLFTNRSLAKDEQVLLILVKPTIVISREQEQRQFPLLSNRIAG